MSNDLKEKLYEYLQNPTIAKNNLELAKIYEKQGQLAGAFSFYLRTAEIEEDSDLAYECLIKLANILTQAQTREYSVEGMLLNAASLRPKRPEAYFFLSMAYERQKKWRESYTFAKIGETLSHEYKSQLDLGYPGFYGLLFQRAISAWWVGLFDESINLMFNLRKNYDLKPEFKNPLENNLINLEFSKIPFDHYKQEDCLKLKKQFLDSNIIRRNFSEVYQDIFILTLLNGKKGGSYLEIGSADPYYGNNTAILEEYYDWKGISIEIDQKLVETFNERRKNQAVCIDATKLNYNDFLKQNFKEEIIDYLQIDCEPAQTSFDILKKIPFDKYKFRIITFEHDFYLDKENKKEEDTIKHKSRQFLKEKGYEPIILNVAASNGQNFEDWWIKPELNNKELVQKIKQTSKELVNIKELLFI
jgi:hypothetical protein